MKSATPRETRRTALFQRLAGLFLALVAVVPAHAHPGHGLGETTMRHVLTSPYHLAMLALTGASLFLVARFVQQPAPRRVVQSLGFAALVGAVLLWGIRA